MSIVIKNREYFNQVVADSKLDGSWEGLAAKIHYLDKYGFDPEKPDDIRVELTKDVYSKTNFNLVWINGCSKNEPRQFMHGGLIKYAEGAWGVHT